MVCSDDHRASHASHCIQQSSDAMVNRLDCLSGGLHDAGVPHHVWIGVVDHHQGLDALLDGFDAAHGEGFGVHGRGLVIGGYTGRGH